MSTRSYLCKGRCADWDNKKNMENALVKTSETNGLASGLLVCLLTFGAFIFYVLFAVSAGSPLFGSDEYAYFISGKYRSELQTLYTLDPGLQRITNLLYFKIVHAFIAVFGSHFVDGFRVIHALEYIITALLLYQTTVSLVDRRSALLGVTAFLLMPTHIYIYAVMPEIELLMASALLGFVVVRVFPKRAVAGSFLSAIILAFAILIKPHAVAMLLAVLVVFAVAGYWRRAGNRFLRSVSDCGITLIACYVSLVILWRLSSGYWNLDPSAALGLQFYGSYLHSAGVTVPLNSKILSAISYAGAHLAIVLLIFSPVMVWTGARIWRTTVRRDDQSEDAEQARSMLALFSLTMLLSHVAMTAWFTAGAAALNQGEALRLHGRYLGPALLFFPMAYFFALKDMTLAGRRMTTALIAFSLLVCTGVVFKNYKIFPWDYPLAFAFFNPQNWYHWGHPLSVSGLGIAISVAILAGLLASLLTTRFQTKILSIQLFLILAVGSFQTYGWVYAQLQENQVTNATSRALGMLLGAEQIGKGVLVSEERYGKAAYILFGLGNAPVVITRKSGVAVTERDVQGADWLLLDGDYPLSFQPQGSLEVGDLRLIVLNPHALRGRLNIVNNVP